MTTLTTMIEACLNSRPLCPLTNDPENLDVLTPGHFLIGSPILTTPHDPLLEKNPNILTRWQLIDRMHQDFWKRWSVEYLSRLQHRPKWVQQQSNFMPGNIVLIKEENLPPTKWALGRITSTHPGKDGLVRVVTLKTATTTLKRPITKLALLPIIDNEEATSSQIANLTSIATAGTSPKPQSSTSTKRKLTTQTGKEKTKHIKTKPAKISANLLFTLIFGLLVVLACGENPKKYNITEFQDNQGIYFEFKSNANVYKTEWTLITHFNLSAYENQLTMLRPTVMNLKLFCKNARLDVKFKPHCTSVFKQLEHQVKEIEDANELIHHQNKYRLKRAALFGFVGKISNSLFGVLDEEFAEGYEDQISKLKNNEAYMKNLLQNQISIAESTTNIIKRTREDIHQQFTSIKQHLYLLEEELNHSQLTTQLERNFNSAVTLIIMDINNILHIQQAILSIIRDAHHGKINTLILTPSQLILQLQLIQQNLKSNLKIPGSQDQNPILTLYNLMEVKTRMTAKTIIFEIKIPLMEAEQYKLYHLIPIPMIKSDVFCYVLTSSTHIMINTHRDRYNLLTENDVKACHKYNHGNLLCKMSLPMYNLRSNKSRCELELLTIPGKFSPFCNFKNSKAEDIWINLHNENNWIYIFTTRTIVDIGCEDFSDKLTLIGKGIFQLTAGCHIKHSTMSLFTSNKITGNLNSSFFLNSNLPRELLETPEINNLSVFPNFVNEVSSSDIDNLHSMIIDQKRAYDSQIFTNHDIHHYSWIYILVSASLVAILFHWYRRRQAYQHQHLEPSQSNMKQQGNPLNC